VCMNVLEHIEDDRTTLRDFASVLPPGGHLVLLVPALKALYGTLDKHLHHFRRYSAPELRRVVTEAGFEVETIRYLNRLAVFGWWLSSRVLKRRVMPKAQLKAFKWIMPLLKLEEASAPRFGLSLLVLARRTWPTEAPQPSRGDVIEQAHLRAATSAVPQTVAGVSADARSR